MKAKDLLIKKSKVEFLYNDITIGEALTIMNRRRYQMIPVLERNSLRYLYSVSSGDFLRKFLEDGDIEKTKNAPLSSVTVERLIISCSAESEIDEFSDLITLQNYVPMVDDRGVFQGIVTRRSIMNYLLNKAEE